jgi:hypothetical protein
MDDLQASLFQHTNPADYELTFQMAVALGDLPNNETKHI